MYSGRHEPALPVTIYFVKVGLVLSDILASQKCIKWGWHIIRGCMTVPINEIACKMALARKVQNYTFKIALEPFTQCFVSYLGGLELSGGFDIQAT